eukprot:s88_g34.t1
MDSSICALPCLRIVWAELLVSSSHRLVGQVYESVHLWVVENEGDWAIQSDYFTFALWFKLSARSPALSCCAP